MGFVRAPAFHDLVFTGDLAGLEVRVRHLSGRDMAMVGGLETAPTVSNPLPLLSLFDVVVDSWNLELTDGAAVPASAVGLMAQDIEFVKAVLAAFLETLSLPYSSPVAVGSSPTGRRIEVDTAPQVGGSDMFTNDVVDDDAGSIADYIDNDAADAEDMHIPTPPGPDLSHLTRFTHTVSEPIPA